MGDRPLVGGASGDMARGAATGVLVVVPWRSGCPHREAALSWVTGRWAELGFPVRLGRHDEGLWCKSLAVSDGIARNEPDVLVVADADVFTDGAAEAVDLVRGGAPWAVPHNYLYRLSRDATAAVLDGTPPDTRMPLAEGTRPYRGRSGGGIVVVRFDVWVDCPIDPRFRGWGQEDESWALALSVLYGKPHRLDHPLWHLWHPPQERMNRGLGSTESLELYKRYSKAIRDCDVMRALIDEARERQEA